MAGLIFLTVFFFFFFFGSSTVGEVESALNMSPEDFHQKYGAQKPSKEDSNIVFHCRDCACELVLYPGLLTQAPAVLMFHFNNIVHNEIQIIHGLSLKALNDTVDASRN